MTDNCTLKGLIGLVQYRRKDVGDEWHNMAAFDSFNMAERYAAGCAASNPPWEYRAIDLEDAATEGAHHAPV